MKNLKQSLSPPCSPSQDAVFDLDQPKVTVVPPPVCHKNVCQLLHSGELILESLYPLEGTRAANVSLNCTEELTIGQTKTLPKCKLLICRKIDFVSTLESSEWSPFSPLALYQTNCLPYFSYLLTY